MKTEGTNLLLRTIFFLLELIYVTKGQLDELQKAEKYH